MPLRPVNPHLLQLGRFIAVGSFNTAFSYAIYALLLSVHVGYAMANLAAIMLGILVGFKTQGTLVFRHAGNRRILRFVIAWALIYVFNVFLISRFITAGCGAYVSGALAIPFTTAISYLMQKFFVFAKPRPAEST